MARFLLDTSVLIDYLRGHPEVVTRTEALVNERHDLGICAINVAEIFAGMREHERESTERFLSAFLFFDLSYEVARLAGELRAQLTRGGTNAALADMLVASV